VEQRLEQQVTFQTSQIKETNTPKIYSFDIDVYEALSEESFKAVWDAVLQEFQQSFSRDARLQVVSRSGKRPDRLAAVLSQGTVFTDMDADLRDSVARGETRLVNLVGFSVEQKTFQRPAMGRLLPVLKLKEGDVQAVRALFEIARAEADADLSLTEDVTHLAGAWRVLSGLHVPTHVLKELVGNTAALELILKYVLLPVAPVSVDLMREYLAERAAQISA
jgi:hypothetical protein